jgi:exodeoxyribonuclease VII large subunit
VLHGLTRAVTHAVRASTARRDNELTGLAIRAEVLPRVRTREHAADVARLDHDLRAAAARALERAANALTLLERDVRSRDPADVLRRGYSITRAGGRAVRSARDVRPGERLETMLHAGRVTSVVEEIETIE